MWFTIVMYKMRKEGLIGVDGVIGFGIAAMVELAAELSFIFWFFSR